MLHSPTINRDEALARSALFSNWTSKKYIPVDREVLRESTKACLKVFYEEELDVPLVLFNDVLDHVLRIDRVFRQIQGHLLLIGVCGSGKVNLVFLNFVIGLKLTYLQYVDYSLSFRRLDERFEYLPDQGIEQIYR